jgi:Ca2+-binding RTX toxin-like protein
MDDKADLILGAVAGDDAEALLRLARLQIDRLAEAAAPAPSAAGWSLDADGRMLMRGSDDVFSGGRRDDWVAGREGHDRMLGRGGDDFLEGDGGNDTLRGGAGDDTLIGAAQDDRVYGGAGSDRLYGWNDDDLLVGGARRDVLFGGEGNDTLYGGRGDDYLCAGSGDDALYGGSGRDMFVFRPPLPGSRSTYMDFDPAEDVLRIQSALMPDGLTLAMIETVEEGGLRIRAAGDSEMLFPGLTDAAALLAVTTLI